MANDRHEIKFSANVEELKEGLRALGPFLRQLEQQLALNIPIRPSILDKSGSPWSGGGGGGFGGGGSNMGPGGGMSQLPAYQFLQMQENFRAKNEQLSMMTGGKTATQALEDKLVWGKKGGGVGEDQAMGQLLAKFRAMDDEASKATSALRGLASQTEMTTEDMEKAAKHQKTINDITRDRMMGLKQAGVGAPGEEEGGGSGINFKMLGAVVGAAVKAVQVAFEIPMQQAAARAITGQIGGRNIAATMGMSSFENMMRMDPGVRDTATIAGRTTGTVRGITEGVWGAGISGAVMGGLYGGGLPGAVVGGIGGFVGKAGLNVLSGNVERQQGLTFEERMLSETQARAEEGERFKTGRSVYRTLRPLSEGYGWGGRRTAAYGEHLREFSSKYGFNAEDTVSGAQAGMGALRGGVANAGNWDDVGRMKTGTGLGFGEIGSLLNQFSSGKGSGADQARNLEDILARGVSRGFNNSAMLRSYMEVVSRAVSGAMGQRGSSAVGAIGGMMDVYRETFGEKGTTAVTGGAADAASVMGKMESSTGGITGMANAAAADAVRQKLLGLDVDPQVAFSISRMFMSATQQELSSPEIYESWARMTDGKVSGPMMKNILQGGAAAKLEGISRYASALGGKGGMALIASQHGGLGPGTTAAEMVPGAIRKLSGHRMFDGRGHLSLEDQSAAVRGTPDRPLEAAEWGNALAIAFSTKTLKEMGTRLHVMVDNMGKLNDEVKYAPGHFKALNLAIDAIVAKVTGRDKDSYVGLHGVALVNKMHEVRARNKGQGKPK